MALTNAHLGSDVAVPDNAQCLAADLKAVVRHLVPLTVMQLFVAVAKLPRQRDDLRNDELRCNNTE